MSDFQGLLPHTEKDLEIPMSLGPYCVEITDYYTAETPVTEEDVRNTLGLLHHDLQLCRGMQALVAGVCHRKEMVTAPTTVVFQELDLLFQALFTFIPDLKVEPKSFKDASSAFLYALVKGPSRVTSRGACYGPYLGGLEILQPSMERFFEISAREDRITPTQTRAISDVCVDLKKTLEHRYSLVDLLTQALKSSKGKDSTESPVLVFYLNLMGTVLLRPSRRSLSRLLLILHETVNP